LKPLTALELIQHFDRLPEDALVPLKVSRIVRGTSEWTDRRKPMLPRRRISAGRYGHRVGDIRALARGTSQSDSRNPA
jgi:hypothetical protein